MPEERVMVGIDMRVLVTAESLPFCVSGQSGKTTGDLTVAVRHHTLRLRGAFRVRFVGGCLRTHLMNASNSGARLSSASVGYSDSSVRFVNVA